MKDPARGLSERLLERLGHHRIGAQDLEEFGGFAQMPAQPKSDHADQEAAKERQAPAPGL